MSLLDVALATNPVGVPTPELMFKTKAADGIPLTRSNTYTLTAPGVASRLTGIVVRRFPPLNVASELAAVGSLNRISIWLVKLLPITVKAGGEQLVQSPANSEAGFREVIPYCGGANTVKLLTAGEGAVIPLSWTVMGTPTSSGPGKRAVVIRD